MVWNSLRQKLGGWGAALGRGGGLAEKSPRGLPFLQDGEEDGKRQCPRRALTQRIEDRFPQENIREVFLGKAREPTKEVIGLR